MNAARTIARLVIGGIVGTAGFPAMTSAQTAEPALPTLPFAIQVTEEQFADQDRPDYMSPKNSCPMDFPFSPVMIDGEFWVFCKNGYHGPRVYRYKGTTIENAVRQPGRPRAMTGTCGGSMMSLAGCKIGGSGTTGAKGDGMNEEFSVGYTLLVKD